MTSYSVTESPVEDATLTGLEGLGWQVAHGPDIAPDAPNAERDRCGQGGSGAPAANNRFDDLRQRIVSFSYCAWDLLSG